MRRRVNLKFLIWFLVSLLFVGSLVHVAHAIQKPLNAKALYSQGERAEDAGEFDRASTYLARYLSLVPTDTSARVKLALLLDKLAQSPRQRLRVFEQLERALREDPSHEIARRRLVDVAIELKRYSDAAHHIRTLQEDHSDDGELLHLQGRCLEGMGNYDAAADVYEQAIQFAPHKIDTYEQLAELLRRELGKGEQADDVMARMIESNAVSATAFLARSRYRQRLGSQAAAYEDAKRAFELAPNDADAILSVSELTLLDAKTTEAAKNTEGFKAKVQAVRELIERGCKLYPKDNRFYQAMSACELEVGLRDDAILALRHGLEEIPNDPELLWRLAELLTQGGDDRQLEEASELIRELQKKNADPATLDLLKAGILVQKEEWYQARKQLERVRPLLAHVPAIQQKVDLLLGHCYEKLENPDLQLMVYRRVVGNDPMHVPARLGLAAALAALGREEEALAEYRRIMTLPGAAEFGWTPAVGWARVAGILFIRNLRAPGTARDWTEVEEALDESLAQSPDLAEGKILRAHVMAAQGKWTSAGDLLRGSLQKNPNEPQVWLALSGIALQAGGPGGALAVLDEARQSLGDTVELRLARAVYLVRAGDEKSIAAIPDLGTGLEGFAWKDQTALLQGLGDVLLGIGKTATTMGLWEQAAKQQPNEIRVRFKLAGLALQESDDASALRWINEIRRIEGPTGPIGNYSEAARLIEVARKDGDFAWLDRARTLVDSALVERPSWSRLSLAKAEIDDILGKTDSAIEHYQRAVDLGERNQALLRRLAELLASRQRFVEADQVIRRLELQGPLPSDVQQIAREVSLQLGDYQKATEAARAAITAEPKDFRHHIWLGHVLSTVGKQAEAEESFRRAVELGTNEPQAWAALIHFLARTGNKEAAEGAIEQAQQNLRTELAPLVLGQCFELVGRRDEAEQQYQAILREKPTDIAIVRSVSAFYVRTGQSQKAEPLLMWLMEGKKVEDSDSVVAWARRTLAISLLPQADNRKVRRALSLIEQNLKTGKTNAADLRAKAVVLMTVAGYRREALATYEELARHDSLTNDEKFLMADLYHSVNNWRRYSDMILGLLSSQPENPNYLHHYVRASLLKGHIAEAEPWLLKLEKIEPESLRVLRVKARFLRAAGRSIEAAALVQSYAQRTDAQLVQAAAILEEIDESSAAEELYAKFVANSKQPESILVLAAYYGRQKRIEQALDLCEQALERCAPEIVAEVAATIVHSGKVDPKQCNAVARWIEEMILKKPDSLTLLVGLAHLRFLQGRFLDAEALYDRIVKQSPDHVIAINNLAWLLAHYKGNTAESLRLINRAIEVSGPLPDLLDTRGSILVVAGHFDQAIKDLEEAVTLSPSPIKYFHLAQANLGANNKTAALAAFQKAGDLSGTANDFLHPLERPGYDRLVATLRAK